ncbi:glycoside hydrolase family 65 protein [Bifidobacterium kimbladii]|uniref:Glycosyl hydrolase n=1 Tax=Bifidobacterium asteroides TaxID=1684 RepID=A0A0F4L1C4_9BIFI|nr:glycosyl hydrolase family 65 protein [Bifidobacterium asteroides]KJY52465.1 Glycosyl hydrolase [Bifidobacterium asteroides]
MLQNLFSNKVASMLPDEPWLIHEDSYDPNQNLAHESLFALSNGYMGIRGSHEEGTKPSLPYVYINGIFDKSETFMKELATLPNWLGIRLYVNKCLLGIGGAKLLEYQRVLDMKDAALFKHLKLRDEQGRETLIEGMRFVSRAHTHRMGIRLWITPLNYSGLMELEQITDGSIVNFCDAPRFKVKHTLIVCNEALDTQGVYLEAATRDSGLHVGVGSKIVIRQGDEVLDRERVHHAFGEQGIEFTDFQVEQGKCTEVTKYVSMYDVNSCSGEELKSVTAHEVSGFIKDGFGHEYQTHKDVYENMWGHADIVIDGDPDLDKAVRFNVYHLMSAANERNSYVNVGAKLLSGEEYGGHAFWDTELFMMPFFAFVFPKTAKNLEEYRYHLLGAAEKNAATNGFKGAQYPWESADDGSEQSPAWTIEPDGTCYRCYVSVYEHHVTAAVAYGVYEYARITGDKDFLYGPGAEILVQTARFWASRCEWNQEDERYEITKVTGPDEWHEPVNNNTYTNYLVRWNMQYVIDLAAYLERDHKQDYETLIAKTGLTANELGQWSRIVDKLYLPRKAGSPVFEQFEGYFDLMPLTIETYDQNDWPVKPPELDRIDVSQTQIIKQADVVMLMHLLTDKFSQEELSANYRFYERRTLHGSSLSPSIYAIMGLKVGDGSKAYRYLRRAATLDLLNLQGNTREGIHGANAGGVWQTVIFGFAGVAIGEDGTLAIAPKMPETWNSLHFQIMDRDSQLDVLIQHDNSVQIRLLDGPSVTVLVNGQSQVVK